MDVRTRRAARLVAVPLAFSALAAGVLSHAQPSDRSTAAGPSAAGALDVPDLVAGKTTKGTGRRVR